MHDVLAHRLSLVALHAGALEYCRGLSDAEVAEAAAVTRRSAHRPWTTCTRSSGSCAPSSRRQPPEPPQPTLVDLPSLVEEAAGCRARGCGCTTAIGDLAQAPDAIGRSVYRMVQESLTNARKHAPDTTVDVTLSGEPGRRAAASRCATRSGSAPQRARHPARAWACSG